MCLISPSMQKIRKWFYNNNKTGQTEYFKFLRKWSARSVYYHQNRARVLKGTESSRYSSGQPGYTGTLQLELSRLWKKASENEKKKYQALADSWSTNQPPENVQARLVASKVIRVLFTIPIYRMASSMHKRMTRDFQRQIFKNCGIQTLILTAYKDEDGSVRAVM